MTREDLASYKWYHHFDFGDGLTTTPKSTEVENFVQCNMAVEGFRTKSVIDIGCRDGRFSFLAEKLGASRVVAVDNDLSKGMTELLIPHFKSRIEAWESNLTSPAEDWVWRQAIGHFDIVMLFGVLYHLRYPVFGLKRAVDLMRDGGLLLIETAVFRSAPQHLPMMFCPWKEMQPYEPGSVSYFNVAGLKAVMDSLGCTLVREDDLVGSDTATDSDFNVRRGFFVFKKTHETPQYLREYWDGVHCCQSAMVENSVRQSRG